MHSDDPAAPTSRAIADHGSPPAPAVFENDTAHDGFAGNGDVHAVTIIARAASAAGPPARADAV